MSKSKLFCAIRRFLILPATRTTALSLAVGLINVPAAEAQRSFKPLSVVEARTLEAKLLILANKTRADELTHFDQREDVQQLLRWDPRRNHGNMRLASLIDDLHAFGVLIAQPGASKLSDAQFESNGGASIGTAYVTADVKSLNLLKKDASAASLGKGNAVIVHKNGNQWSAMIDGDAARSLRVTRYVYAKKNNDDDYVDNGRWDWERGLPNPETPTTQVIGFPCGHGWCLVGTLLTTPPDAVDPLDPDQDGTKGHASSRRIPGWFDRAIDPIDPAKTIWIYPTDKLDHGNQPPQFKDRYQQVATIEDSNGLMYVGVGLQYFPNGANLNEKWKVAVEGKFFHVDFVTMDPNRPSGVRWKTALAPTARIGPLFSDGGIWMSCPNGCCSASITF